MSGPTMDELEMMHELDVLMQERRAAYDHVKVLVEYLYEDEKRSFEENYLGTEFKPKHKFTSAQREHIFYHIEILNRMT